MKIEIIGDTSITSTRFTLKHLFNSPRWNGWNISRDKRFEKKILDIERKRLDFGKTYIALNIKQTLKQITVYSIPNRCMKLRI